mmetsp:Transcript_81838/g.162473  ORF Transcript_81838/g.162473 Transcript_81838/m.162473 type:complete len:341 (-) Transcript_81838:57-1079(-)
MADQCDNSSGRTPVSILTGFLGAGKTTLVNHILRERHGLRIAVIENEFGEVGVDDAIVLETEEEIFEMNNGCVCCTVRGDLIRILERLGRQRTGFDHVLIETTGLADPGPVAQTFFVSEEIKAKFELDAIITVVDAKHALPHIQEEKPEGVENECVEQIAFADKILLNKVDLVASEEKQAMLDRLKAINSGAEVIETTQSQVDMSRILGVKAFDLGRILEMDEEFLNTDGEHQHDSSVGSVGISFEGELDLTALNNWLSRLLERRGVDLFRSKGVAHVRGSDARHVFHGVHMLMTMSTSDEGAVRPWKPGEPRMNRLVFIGRNLDREELSSGAQSCLARP